VTERLAAEGYQVVPHLSARLVRDAAHLDEIVARLQAAGVREAFVPAGDATNPGQFPDAASLLRAMDARHFTQLGITGYPASHHFISDETTMQAMCEKAPMANYFGCQVCFDASAMDCGVRLVRAHVMYLTV